MNRFAFAAGGTASSATLAGAAILVQLLAWTKIAAATGAVACAAATRCTISDDPVLYAARTAQMAVYAGVAVILLAPNREPGARAFALLLVTIAAAFAQGLVQRTDIWAMAQGFGPLLLSARAESFMPFAAFLFASRFPALDRPSVVLDRLGTLGTWIGFVVAAGLFVANLHVERVLVSDERSAYDVLTPGYWTIVFGMVIASLALVIAKAQRAPIEGAARARLIVASLVIVTGAMTAYVVAMEQLPVLRESLMGTPLHGILMPLLQVLVLSIPLVATYALLVERALDQTMQVRNVVGYRLASFVLAIGAAVPFLLVAWYLWNLRALTIEDAFSGPTLLALGGALALGLLLVRVRGSAQRAVDRAFVRLSYDASAALVALHERMRNAPDLGSLADAAEHCFKETLGVSRAVLAVRSESFGPVARGALAELPSTLFAALSRRSGVTNGGDSDEMAAAEADQWRDDQNLPWLEPVVSDAGATVALLALSAKQRAAPVTDRDREFVHTAARHLAPAVARLLEHATLTDPARECSECATVLEARATVCTRCASGELRPAHLPKRLEDRFTVLRRLGSGSMGVVYEARDESLGRRVALKTLPRVSPTRATQLREEAHAMARVSHPNLATVHQLEVWRDVPVIVMELFEDGTLAERLGKDMPEEDLKRLGIGLAEGLVHLHGLGIVHADIKPTNLGVAASGSAKIMDFGLARLPAGPVDATAEPADAPRDPFATYRAGTPAYLAPELVRGGTQSFATDVWALTVSLYEIFTGANPFRRTTLAATLRAVLREPVPDVRTNRRDASEALARLFEDSLSREGRDRPTDARTLLQRLASL